MENQCQRRADFRMKPRRWPVLLASGFALAILLWLGVWQVQRLAWKEALIAEMDANLGQPPVTFAEAVAAGPPDNRKLRVNGRFEGQVLRKITAGNGGPGFDIIQAFVTEAGNVMLVARGISAEGQAVPPVAGATNIVGIMKRHDGGQGRFDPDNDAAANRWYWWDVAAMAQASHGKAVSHADLVLHLLPGSPGTEGLFVAPPKAGLRNNHLGYAITWFGLAAVLVVMTGVFLRGRNKT
jgi:surfeit locus 1 family protein